MKNYFSLVSSKTKMKCGGIILLAFVSSVLASTWPVLLGELYTEISNGTVGTIAQGVKTIAIFGFVYLSAECIAIFRRVMLDCIIATHEAEIRECSVERLLKMPVAYYNGCHSGEKAAQLNQGVAGFSQLIKISCNDILATTLTAICTLIQVVFNAPGLMAGVMLLYLVVTIVISVFQIRSQNGIRENIIAKRNALEGQICESINNLELVRSMHAEGYEKRRLRPAISDISNTEKNHHKYMGIFDGIKQICKIGFQILLLVASIFMISKGEMSSGTVITVCLLFQQLVKPIDEVYRFMDETASSVVKAKILVDMTKNGMDSVYNIESTEKEPDNSGIVLKNIEITNPLRDKVLARYKNIVIPCGKKVALKGANGSGKTTLIRSLTRYYPIGNGTVTILGYAQDTYSQKELTSLLYYSPQVSIFIAGSVRDNLIYGLERSVSDDELVSALMRVRLVGNYEGIISEDPYKALEHSISEGAKELSGGMKQRLALARAFLRKPKFFIFDEITANLDDDATDYVLTSIESYAEEIDAGIIYISHEKKVVDRCDEVIMLENMVKFQEQVKAA